VLGHFDEAIAIPRLFHFGEEEIQFDEIEVLNFIGAALDELAGGHKGWDVPAYPHPSRVRAIGHDRDEFRFDGRINLDLDVTVIGMPIDELNRFLGRVGPHLGWPGELSCAIDDSRLQNTGSELAPIVVARDALREGVGVIGHIARAGHAVGEIEGAAFGIGQMLVVVPQPGHQEAAFRVDDLGAGRWLDAGIGSDANDAITAHQHTDSRRNAEIARIEQASVADNEVATRLVGEDASDAFRPGGGRLFLGLEQLWDRGLQSLGYNRKPRRDRRRGAVAIEPDRLRSEAEPGDAVLGEFAFVGRCFSGLLDARLAGGQQRQFASGRFQQGTRERAHEFRRRVERQIERLGRHSLIAFFAAIFPARFAALHFEVLFDGGFHVIVAAAVVFDRQAVGIELPGSNDVIAAAAIIVGIFNAHPRRQARSGPFASRPGYPR